MDNLLYNQLMELAHFFIAGFEIGILFDIFRAQRKAIKTSDIITYIQDILFWFVTGIIVIHTIAKYTNGEVRSYMVIGLFLGVILYFTFITKFALKILFKLICCLKKIVNIILYPVKKIIN
ncbi:MAG: spore cortex biosynthesis protein YabQ [Clostridia bacterium]|nr:spore cortex biosynthesis protein YabQ [Clostridia bacterium]